MAMASYEDIEFKVRDGIAEIVLDRPEVANAFRQNTIVELNQALADVATDGGIVALILTGRGDQFCAGADLSTMPDWSEQTEAEYGRYLWAVQNVVRDLLTMPTPTIAVVDGAAVGAGCDFALGCDMRFLDPGSTLTEGFVRVGLVPGDGGGWLLPRLIGRARAMEYLLTGAEMSAEKAAEIGLANGVSENPLERARDLASDFRDMPLLAVRRTKELSLETSFEEYCQQAITYQYECVHDEEHDEAVAAMRERRAPEFDRYYTDTRTD